MSVSFEDYNGNVQCYGDFCFQDCLLFEVCETSPKLNYSLLK